MGHRETKRQVQRGGLLDGAYLEGEKKEADMGEVGQDKETPHLKREDRQVPREA